MEERIFQASAREIASGKVLRWEYDWHAYWHAFAMTRRQVRPEQNGQGEEGRR